MREGLDVFVHEPAHRRGFAQAGARGRGGVRGVRGVPRRAGRPGDGKLRLRRGQLRRRAAEWGRASASTSTLCARWAASRWRRSMPRMEALAEEIGGTSDWRTVVERPARRPSGIDGRPVAVLPRRDGAGPRLRARERPGVHPRGRGVRGGAGAAVPAGRRPGGVLLPPAVLRAAGPRDVQRPLHARRRHARRNRRPACAPTRSSRSRA